MLSNLHNCFNNNPPHLMTIVALEKWTMNESSSLHCLVFLGLFAVKNDSLLNKYQQLNKIQFL